MSPPNIRNFLPDFAQKYSIYANSLQEKLLKQVDDYHNPNWQSFLFNNDSTTAPLFKSFGLPQPDDSVQNQKRLLFSIMVGEMFFGSHYSYTLRTQLNNYVSGLFLKESRVSDLLAWRQQGVNESLDDYLLYYHNIWTNFSWLRYSVARSSFWDQSARWDSSADSWDEGALQELDEVMFVAVSASAPPVLNKYLAETVQSRSIPVGVRLVWGYLFNSYVPPQLPPALTLTLLGTESDLANFSRIRLVRDSSSNYLTPHTRGTKLSYIVSNETRGEVIGVYRGGVKEYTCQLPLAAENVYLTLPLTRQKRLLRFDTAAVLAPNLTALLNSARMLTVSCGQYLQKTASYDKITSTETVYPSVNLIVSQTTVERTYVTFKIGQVSYQTLPVQATDRGYEFAVEGSGIVIVLIPSTGAWFVEGAEEVQTATFFYVQLDTPTERGNFEVSYTNNEPIRLVEFWDYDNLNRVATLEGPNIGQNENSLLIVSLGQAPPIVEPVEDSSTLLGVGLLGVALLG